MHAASGVLQKVAERSCPRDSFQSRQANHQGARGLPPRREDSVPTRRVGQENEVNRRRASFANRYLAPEPAAKSKQRPRAARESAVSVLMRAVHRKPDASRLRLSRHPRRERNDRSQPGMIVLKLELAPMQPRHRRREAEPESGAGLRAALLEPDDTLDRASAIGLGNA